MTHAQLTALLVRLAPLLDAAAPEWCVFSSAAACLMSRSDRLPSDLDIMMSVEGAIRCEQSLAAYRLPTLPPESGKYRSRRSLYLIDGIEVDISGGLECLVDGEWVPATALPSLSATIDLQGHRIRLRWLTPVRCSL